MQLNYLIKIPYIVKYFNLINSYLKFNLNSSRSKKGPLYMDNINCMALSWIRVVRRQRRSPGDGHN